MQGICQWDFTEELEKAAQICVWQEQEEQTRYKTTFKHKGSNTCSRFLYMLLLHTCSLLTPRTSSTNTFA